MAEAPGVTSGIQGEVRPLITVRNLTTRFHTEEGQIDAVNDVSFDVAPSEVLGIVGESGCGKSATALSVMGLIRPPGEIVAGQIIFKGRDLRGLTPKEMKRLRGNEISMVFQDPTTSLNPVSSVGRQVTEMLERHEGMSSREARSRAVDLLKMVNIPDAASRIDDYPHQFSGGMRQRVMLAIALSCNPSLIIADEPTTALDVTIQAQILDLFGILRSEFEMALILITHDLGVVAGLADRVNVMYAGEIVEAGSVEDIFYCPSHPYTRGLLRSIPLTTGPQLDRLKFIDGQPPDLLNSVAGCQFWDRCEYRSSERCKQERPHLREISSGHYVATFCDNLPVYS